MASHRWDTGIEIIGDLVGWGTHFCAFYETKQDLLDMMISYYKLGLERGEYCLWVVPEPLTIEEATHALKEAVPDFDRYVADSSLEFIAARDWFLRDGEMDFNRVSSQFQEKLALAMARGFSGMRVSGDTTGLKKDWRHFCEWEDSLNAGFVNQHLAGMCPYPLADCGALEILDILRAHQFAIARRRGSWDVVETAGLRQAKDEIKKLNEELEKRVEDRTQELVAANEKLQCTAIERDRSQAALAMAFEKIKASEAQLREIVDAIPQAITVLDPEGRALYVNQWVLDFTGFTPEDVLSPDYRTKAFHPEDVARLQKERQEALSLGLPFENEQRALRKDGTYRWFLVRYNPLRDESGRILRWYATGTDIEERKQAELRVSNENLALREELDRSSMHEEIVGSSESLRHVLVQIHKVAPTESTVLILGETGTGKELIAGSIHKRSRRSNRAFIRVNCAAIPPSLIASELFGHEKGAFTGASQRRLGRFESANGGTIFLDEIGELPSEAQVALLRVLQEREFERVGSSKPISVDVRVIAATNRDLEAAVKAGTFRQDLFYRLNVFPISVPSLRERKDDIPLLVEYLVERFANRAGKKFNHIKQKTLDLLQSYDWPGNIRELQNVIERAVILSETETFAVDETWLRRKGSEGPQVTRPLSGALLQQERDIIEAALEASHGRVAGAAGAAARLGVPTRTLDSKIKRLGIDKYRFKSSS